MPSKRKASPATKPESTSASRKSKRLAVEKPDPVVAPLADNDFEEESVLSTKKKSTRKTTAGSPAVASQSESTIRAEVDGQIYYLEDDVHVKAADGEVMITFARLSIFEAVDGMQYFTAQWFYRAKDTVIKSHQFIDNKRVFLLKSRMTTHHWAFVTKLKIVPVPSNATLQFKENVKSNCDYYYDMKYLLPYSSFISLPPDTTSPVSSSSTISSDIDADENMHRIWILFCFIRPSPVILDAEWAVDLNKHACDSLRLNHPETQVSEMNEVEEEDDDQDEVSGDDKDGEVFEVEELLEICYGDPKEMTKTRTLLQGSLERLWPRRRHLGANRWLK
ncbi:hypothetical protein HAX54_019846 [Datura stramonium]|uniref:BAH domain-containing protein n=1 Tax=Datura stramonium TaxID=4076 RepID=A0ABS8UPX5_DATST|nr:hypothetical protein [Datura stramonium]